MSIGICTACSHLLLMWRWRYWSQRRNLIGAHWCPFVPSGARWWGTKRTILTPAGTRWPPFGTRLITTVSWANNFELDYFTSNIEKRCWENSTGPILLSSELESYCLQHTALWLYLIIFLTFLRFDQKSPSLYVDQQSQKLCGEPPITSLKNN